MRVFLALEKFTTPNCGEFTRVLAVCSTEEKAREAFKYSSWYKYCDQSHVNGINGSYGEDSISIDVEIAELDKEYV